MTLNKSMLVDCGFPFDKSPKLEEIAVCVTIYFNQYSEPSTKVLHTPPKKAHKIVVLEAVARRCSVKKVFLKISQNSQENTCARASFLIKSLAQVFSCEFCEISKNTFSYRRPLVAVYFVRNNPRLELSLTALSLTV